MLNSEMHKRFSQNSPSKIFQQNVFPLMGGWRVKEVGWWSEILVFHLTANTNWQQLVLSVNIYTIMCYCVTLVFLLFGIC